MDVSKSLHPLFDQAAPSMLVQGFNGLRRLHTVNIFPPNERSPYITIEASSNYKLYSLIIGYLNKTPK